MPTADQWNRYFTWFNKAFPTVIVIGGLVVGNYLYRLKNEFKEELLEEIAENFQTRTEAAAEAARVATAAAKAAAHAVPRDAFEVYRTKTNSAVENLSAELRINQATVNGALLRIDENVRDLKTDIREIKDRL